MAANAEANPAVFNPSETELCGILHNRLLRGVSDPRILELDLYGEVPPWELFRNGTLFYTFSPVTRIGPKRFRRTDPKGGTWYLNNTVTLKAAPTFQRKSFTYKHPNSTLTRQEMGDWKMKEFSTAGLNQNSIVLCVVEYQPAPPAAAGAVALEPLEPAAEGPAVAEAPAVALEPEAPAVAEAPLAASAPVAAAPKAPAPPSPQPATPLLLTAPPPTTMTTLLYNSIQADGVMVKVKKLEETSTLQGGEVVSGGNSVKVGDHVVYAASDMVFEVNGENHVFLEEDDIIGVLETGCMEDLIVLRDRVLVKDFEPEEMPPGRLRLSKAMSKKFSIGTVKKVGPSIDKKDGSGKPITITPGNTVLYANVGRDEFKAANGSSYIVIRSSDVRAVIS
ncbi:20 kDa chaperonin, chloroplastic [Linum perenne]